MKIITNNKPREIIYGFELTKLERKEFDYHDDDEILDVDFFRYNGTLYDISEFLICPPDSELKLWDGHSPESYFSGILIKYPRFEWGEIDTDHIIVGHYYYE